MTELENDLDRIRQEKINKIKPENIKKGINIFGIEGTLESGGGIPTEGIKQFVTIEEMNQSTGNEEGDLAIVYSSNISNLKVDTEFTKAILPNTVVLPEAVTDRIEIAFQSINESQRLDCFGNLDNQGMMCDFMTGNPETDYRMEYVSTDGITYTKKEGTPDEITFEVPIKFGNPWEGTEGWNDALGYFFQVDTTIFSGLYMFKENAWGIAPTQLNAKAMNVWKGTYYGPKGLETGTLNKIEDLTDSELKNKCEIYASFIETPIICPEDMSGKFNQYSKAYIAPLDTSNVTNMSNMFEQCGSLTTIPKLDTSKVTNMSKMFYNCENLAEIPLLDTSGVINMSNMFGYCRKILTIPKLNTINVTNMNRMFGDCKSLTSIPELNTLKVTNMSGMFQACSSLTEIPLLDTSGVTDMSWMFQVCSKLTTIPELNTSNVTNMYRMFNECTNLTEIPLLDTLKVTNMREMFTNCENLTTIPLLDTSNVTDMNFMFKGCTNLTEIPLLDTSSVTIMYNMFQNCTNITTIPELNTSSVTNMSDMFSGCTNLTTIPLLDTSSVTSMWSMFCGCTSLTTIPLLDTTSVADMYDTFCNCSSLSDESLNNILQMCINSQETDKTLSRIGLSQGQATRCENLSNWQAFLNAGWTSGY